MTNRAIDLETDVRVLVDLVSTRSESGNEAKAAHVFAHHASQLGLQTEVDVMNNAIAHRGPPAHEVHTHIFLLGHIDTVPGDIPVRIEDGMLFGRGSVDAKGPLAAMLIAASRADLPESVRVTVAGAAGEETAGSAGARFLAQHHRPDACIIGEPSGWDGVTLGYKGRLLVTASATRDLSHTAGPDDSAADMVAQWWRAVTDEVAASNQDHTRVFDALQSTIRHMSTESDGLTETATIEVGFRLPRWISPDQLIEQLTARTPVGVALSFNGAETAHATSRNDPVVRHLSGAIRAAGATPRPKLKTGTADLNVVAPIWRCPIAAYGPGDSALDHTPNEHLSIDEYRHSISVLTAAIESLARELVAKSPCATASAIAI